MNEIAFTVVCSVRDPEQADAWLAWLNDSHMADVCRAGASRAWAVRLDGPEIRLEAHYRFASREAFDAYEREHAPRLRQEGLKLFPTEQGFTYERRLGEIVGTSSA